MDSILKEINNRELALITWIIIAIITFLFFKEFRKFVIGISKIIFSKSFIVIYVFLFGYSYALLVGLHKINVWDCSLIKDTLFWFIGAGIAIVMNSISSDTFYFKRIVFNSIKITIAVEFIINLHVFSYFLEMIFLPILILLGASMAIAESERKLEPVANFLKYLLGITGLIILIIACYKTVQNFRQDFTFSNFQKLVLPSLLTIAFIPFSYILAVFSAYETLFVILTNIQNEKWTKNVIKFEIIKNAKLKLSRIRVIKSNLNLYDLFEANDLKLYIRNLKKPAANKVYNP